MDKLDLYYIDLKYIRKLANADSSVMSVSPQRGKAGRPFVGVVVLVNDREYCIPLTSPKEKFLNKKSQVDFIKIFDEKKKDEKGKFKLIGVLNINNMIPVKKEVIMKIDLVIHQKDQPDVVNHKKLMQKQISWCRKNTEVIKNRANKVYDMVVNMPDKNKNLTRRSLDFLKLEKILDDFQYHC